jgi:HSP20 family molecular chaperone IbpA
MAAVTAGNGHPPQPHAHVHEEDSEYLIELDVSDVDPERINAVVNHGTLEIHAARTNVPHRRHEFRLINPNAEAC